MDRSKKQQYPGQYLDMWANVLQGKDEAMPVNGTGISDLIKAIEDLEYKVRILEQRLAGQDERIREAAREMASKLLYEKEGMFHEINELRMNVPSLVLFLNLKKQVEDLKEETRNNFELNSMYIKERLGE